jgi:hypothetical protein
MNNEVPARIANVQNLLTLGLSSRYNSNEQFGSYLLLPSWAGSVNTRESTRLVLAHSTIVSRWNGLCMEVGGGSMEADALVQQSTCVDTNAQCFTKQQRGDGYFYIINRRSGLALAADGTASGSLIAQRNLNTEDPLYMWQAYGPSTGNTVGSKWLINRASGRCVEVPGWSESPGTFLALLDCVYGWKHFWYNL